jgi:hypothetical protein
MTAPKKTILDLDQLSINDASTGDIRAFAADKCGTEFPEGASREYMIEQVCLVLDWKLQDLSTTATHVVIYIPVSDGDNGTHPYRGMVNGIHFTVQRDTEAELSITQYNSMVDSQSLGFRIEPLNANTPDLPANESMFKRRRKVTGYPIQVLRFLSKG